MNQVQPQRLLTIKQAAAYLGRSVYSTRTLIWGGHIPIVRAPGEKKMWLDLKDLERFVDRCKEVIS